MYEQMGSGFEEFLKRLKEYDGDRSLWTYVKGYKDPFLVSERLNLWAHNFVIEEPKNPKSLLDKNEWYMTDKEPETPVMTEEELGPPSTWVRKGLISEERYEKLLG